MSVLTSLLNRYKAKKTLLTNYSDEESIFIYQMGKVGSTSLEKSIPNSLHIHAFYSKNNTCITRQAGLSKFGVKQFFYKAEREIVQYLLRRVFKKRKQTKIITLVREPIIRNMSMYFHDLDAYLFSAHTNCLNTRQSPLPTRSQPKTLLEQVFTEEFDHYYPLNWFDVEFKPMTGIDVFSKPFNKEQGYCIFEEDNCSVLVIRVDRLNQLSSVIKSFIGQNITLLQDNNAETKWYAELYSDFKQHYKLPQEIESKIKSSQFYQHFFS